MEWSLLIEIDTEALEEALQSLFLLDDGRNEIVKF